MTLRQPLYHAIREAARKPLRHVAAQSDVEIDEAGEEWRALALDATKVLLDLSCERGRRLRSADRPPSWLGSSHQGGPQFTVQAKCGDPVTG